MRGRLPIRHRERWWQRHPSLHRKRSTFHHLVHHSLQVQWRMNILERCDLRVAGPTTLSPRLGLSPLLLPPDCIPIPQGDSYLQWLTRDAAFLPTDSFSDIRLPVCFSKSDTQGPSRLKSIFKYAQPVANGILQGNHGTTPRLQPPGQRRATAGNNAIERPRGRLDPSHGHPHADRLFPGILLHALFFSPPFPRQFSRLNPAHDQA